MISPPVEVIRTDNLWVKVYGWWEDPIVMRPPVPVVANPDGPGIGLWTTFYGEDPWYTSPRHLKDCG